MFKITRLIHLASGVDQSRVEPFTDRLREALAPAQRRLVQPTLAGSRNGGDILLHAQFPNQESWAATEPQLDKLLSDAQVTHVDGVDYEAGAAPAPNSPGSVYRTLLLAVAPQTPPDVAAAFEADLLLMPQYIGTIMAYRLSRPTRTLGASRWTHVFEQDFTDESGLMGAYLMHPIHWARVDRWFDPECPEFIVHERICHSYCKSDAPVLS
jgi:Stress responsive A/B Barrel Domain